MPLASNAIPLGFYCWPYAPDTQNAILLLHALHPSLREDGSRGNSSRIQFIEKYLSNLSSCHPDFWTHLVGAISRVLRDETISGEDAILVTFFCATMVSTDPLSVLRVSKDLGPTNQLIPSFIMHCRRQLCSDAEYTLCGRDGVSSDMPLQMASSVLYVMGYVLSLLGRLFRS